MAERSHWRHYENKGCKIVEMQAATEDISSTTASAVLVEKVRIFNHRQTSGLFHFGFYPHALVLKWV
jgi:hypothetical protein